MWAEIPNLADRFTVRLDCFATLHQRHWCISQAKNRLVLVTRVLHITSWAPNPSSCARNTYSLTLTPFRPESRLCSTWGERGVPGRMFIVKWWYVCAGSTGWQQANVQLDCERVWRNQSFSITICTTGDEICGGRQWARGYACLIPTLRRLSYSSPIKRQPDSQWDPHGHFYHGIQTFATHFQDRNRGVQTGIWLLVVLDNQLRILSAIHNIQRIFVSSKGTIHIWRRRWKVEASS